MNAPLRRLAVVAALLLTSLLVSTTWIQYVRADELGDRAGNTRTLYRELGRERGAIVVGGEEVAVSTENPSGDDDYRYLRSYPRGELYAHTTGHFSVFYGATGLERAMGDVLAGTADQLFYQRVGDVLTGREARGASVETTLDPAAQQAALDALAGQRGAVVALDPRTGDVLAHVSLPAYDPNALAGDDLDAVRQARDALLADPARPLDDRALASRGYPPGSVFKVVTAAAALESGRYEEGTEVPGPAVLDLPLTDVGLPNSGGGACGDGTPTLTDALRTSCNTAFGAIGLDLGADALQEQAQAFGFGEDYRIPLRVIPSTVPDDMDEPQTAQAAIGQFDVRVTPMQIAMVAAGVANDGVVMKPNLVRAVRAADLDVLDEPQPEELGRAVSAETADALTRMMVEVVEDGTGTRAQVAGIQVAGKTGTAQHAEGRAPHAWFTAFAPADDPQVAVAVVVEEGGEAGSEASGGRTAAPVARAVIEAVLQR